MKLMDAYYFICEHVITAEDEVTDTFLLLREAGVPTHDENGLLAAEVSTTVLHSIIDRYTNLFVSKLETNRVAAHQKLEELKKC